MSKKKITKKVTKKVVAKKAVSKQSVDTKVSTGQSGPSIELKFDELNPNEEKLVEVLFTAKGARPVSKLADIQQVFSKEKNPGSTTRNALRRPVRAGLVERVDRGAYRISLKGRKVVNKAHKAHAR